jgi:hypothetical protein
VKERALVARRPRSVLVLATIYVVGVGTYVALLQLDGVTFDPMLTFVLGLASFMFVGLGGVILVRVPGNRIGWVIAASGLGMVGSSVASQLDGLGVVMALGVGSALWMSIFALFVFLMLWFPTGRPPTRRWLWIEWLGYLILGTVIFLSLFSENFCTSAHAGRCLSYVENPIGIAGVPDLEHGASGLLIVFLLVLVGSAVSLIARFVRSRGVERLQLKWFTYSVAMLVSSLVLETFAEAAGFDYNSGVAGAAHGVLFLAVPASAVVAVLRYRLYAIDRIISRTVSYAVVIGLLGAVYLGAVTVLAQTLPVQSDLAVVGATLAVVALFAPLRRRVQRAVDRRFNRTRYMADQEMAAFAHRVRDTTDLGVIEDDVRSVIERTMQPVATGIWFGSGAD